MNSKLKFISGIVLVVLMSMGFITGCEKKEGPLEKTGEAVDEAAKDTERAIEDAVD